MPQAKDNKIPPAKEEAPSLTFTLQTVRGGCWCGYEGEVRVFKIKGASLVHCLDCGNTLWMEV